MTDKVIGDTKYKGKRLSFSNVEVEEINKIVLDSANATNNNIVNNSVEFRPRYNIDTVLVREGFVVNSPVKSVAYLAQNIITLSWKSVG